MDSRKWPERYKHGRRSGFGYHVVYAPAWIYLVVFEMVPQGDSSHWTPPASPISWPTISLGPNFFQSVLSPLNPLCAPENHTLRPRASQHTCILSVLPKYSGWKFSFSLPKHATWGQSGRRLGQKCSNLLWCQWISWTTEWRYAKRSLKDSYTCPQLSYIGRDAPTWRLEKYTFIQKTQQHTLQNNRRYHRFPRIKYCDSSTHLNSQDQPGWSSTKYLNCLPNIRAFWSGRGLEFRRGLRMFPRCRKPGRRKKAAPDTQDRLVGKSKISSLCLKGGGSSFKSGGCTREGRRPLSLTLRGNT